MQCCRDCTLVMDNDRVSPPSIPMFGLSFLELHEIDLIPFKVERMKRDHLTFSCSQTRVVHMCSNKVGNNQLNPSRRTIKKKVSHVVM